MVIPLRPSVVVSMTVSHGDRTRNVESRSSWIPTHGSVVLRRVRGRVVIGGLVVNELADDELVLVTGDLDLGRAAT